ncbi:unnamed protein product, partial [Symbiodinium sp. KB8]
EGGEHEIQEGEGTVQDNSAAQSSSAASITSPRGPKAEKVLSYAVPPPNIEVLLSQLLVTEEFHSLCTGYAGSHFTLSQPSF